LVERSARLEPDHRLRQSKAFLSQGVAQARSTRRRIYDYDGNLVTGTGSYLVPSAAEFPRWELHSTATASPTKPLGVKGVGDDGCNCLSSLR